MNRATQEKRGRLDFDHWAELARDDPDRFEALRQAEIEAVISRAPEAQQQRLRCLQWRIDQERRRAGSALGACIRISRMMWESMAGPGGLLETLNRVGENLAGREPAMVPASNAEIVSFDRNRRRKP
ncbi:MAG TPA: DUF3135 domain-containing protein [Sedimenticola sp.]|nr:DUF3135 domain-containing protein [Sedimenticola sp.]